MWKSDSGYCEQTTESVAWQPKFEGPIFRSTSIIIIYSQWDQKATRVDNRLQNSCKKWHSIMYLLPLSHSLI